jgi:sugar phosphate isomerase/epimerase
MAKERISSRERMKRSLMVARAAAIAPLGCATATAPTRNKASQKLRGNINHSLVSWPFMAFGEKWDLDTACHAARQAGCLSVELVDPDGWATLAQHGLNCAIAPNGMPGEPYVKGLNNLSLHDEVIASTRKVIEAAAKAPVKVSAVIAFTGFKYRDAENPGAGVIDPEEGAENTVNGLKKLASIAEPLGIEIHLEHLNTRVAGDNFRGHPGYQGDRIDYCADIIRRVGSPNVKLLFDLYHVQIMDGDLINRIRSFGTDLIGHIHTAGNPGRRELDQQQEIFYPPIMQALLDIGYKGYVGHEFIPTRDPRAGLQEAIAVCDV